MVAEVRTSRQTKAAPITGAAVKQVRFGLLLRAVGGGRHVAAVLAHVTHARAVARRGRRGGVSRRRARGVTSRRSGSVYAGGRRGAVLLNEAGVRCAWSLTHGAVSRRCGGVRCGDRSGVAAIGRSTGLVLGTVVAG